jgi:hypothetical protein
MEKLRAFGTYIQPDALNFASSLGGTLALKFFFKSAPS